MKPKRTNIRRTAKRIADVKAGNQGYWINLSRKSHKVNEKKFNKAARNLFLFGHSVIKHDENGNAITLMPQFVDPIKNNVI